MANRRQISEEEDTDVNMTPLLDIVFIMLIFFIVTSTFIREPGTDVNRPPAETAAETKPAILVAINANDEIWIDKEMVEVDAVRFIAQRLRSENPRGGAVIQVDRESEARYLVEVMDQLSAAGIQSVAIATERE